MITQRHIAFVGSFDVAEVNSSPPTLATSFSMFRESGEPSARLVRQPQSVIVPGVS
jgi:hypothetical protein